MDEAFQHFFYASYNETVEGRPMPEDAIRDLDWATCPECQTANFIGGDEGPETMIWNW
jgi:hypothetical protein